MTLTEKLQIAALVVGLISAMAAVVATIKIKELHVLVNSRLTELLKTSGLLERSEGKAEGRAEAERQSKAQ